MSTISPGDEVTVTITGTATELHRNYGEWFSLSTGDVLIDVPTTDPNVKVTVLRPDRPTRREVLACHTQRFDRMGVGSCRCGDWSPDLHSGTHAGHLDAVLTKWEDA